MSSFCSFFAVWTSRQEDRPWQNQGSNRAPMISSANLIHTTVAASRESKLVEFKSAFDPASQRIGVRSSKTSLPWRTSEAVCSCSEQTTTAPQQERISTIFWRSILRELPTKLQNIPANNLRTSKSTSWSVRGSWPPRLLSSARRCRSCSLLSTRDRYPFSRSGTINANAR